MSYMQPAFCISVQNQHKFKFIFSDNHAIISRNKVARAKVLEFIDHPAYIAVLTDDSRQLMQL